MRCALELCCVVCRQIVSSPRVVLVLQASQKCRCFVLSLVDESCRWNPTLANAVHQTFGPIGTSAT